MGRLPYAFEQYSPTNCNVCCVLYSLCAVGENERSLNMIWLLWEGLFHIAHANQFGEVVPDDAILAAHFKLKRAFERRRVQQMNLRAGD